MLPVNTAIWIPDGQAGYVEAIVLEEFKPGQPARVQLCKTKAETVLPPAVSKQIERRVESQVEENHAPNDLSSLIHLSRASLLEALRLRHEANKVYTSVGPILVSVNPYKSIPELYTASKQQQYFDFETSDPHVYETASRAFVGATKNKQDQSVIFSGESGAGKTFATKMFTEFLVYASSRSESRSEERALVQQRLQSAQPMIEAFGNAKTSRNDNSSRFGCWTEIEFSGNEICGASVTGFNLEKSRVVRAGKGDASSSEHQRNFHIFYQICAANPKLQGRSFHYLSGTEFTAEDAEHFKLTLRSMEDLAIVDAGKVLEVVEGILELGDVRFRAVEDKVTGEETSELVDRAVVERCCELFGGMDVDEIIQGFLTRDMSNHKEEIRKPHSKVQAEEARDALAKHLYGRLFDWLLVRINEATSSIKRNGGFSASKSSSSSQQGIIGLLDTYGFEIFSTNSFEQLCINYCNERIMSAFNETCIKAEHELYFNEGLLSAPSAGEPFLDRSKVCLELLEATPGGVFAVLDDEIRIPKGNDLQYLRKLRDAQKGHSNLVPYVSELKDSKAKHLFGIVHFAGTVHYCVEDFLEKNRDTLHAQLDRACTDSTGFIGEQLFASHLISLSSSPKKAPKSKKAMCTTASQKQSLALRFRTQLNELMGKISLTQTHFVRCIKPNERSASQFQGPVVLEQLNYGGVLETCRLRKDGYQVRRSHDDFMATYGQLASSKRITTAQELAKDIEARFGISCQIGKTTAFMKAEDFNRLEKALVEQVNDARVKIQSFGRLVLERQKHSKRKLFLDKLRSATKVLDERAIQALLAQSAQVFPKGDTHVPLVKKAREILHFLDVERAICDELNAAQSCAFSQDNLTRLNKAIVTAEAVNHDLTGKVGKNLIEAKELFTQWSAQDARSKATLREKLREEKASSALLRIQRAVKRYVFAKRIRLAFKQLREATASRNVDAVMKAVRRLSELGLRDHPLVLDAAKMLPERKKKPTKQTERVLGELQEAMKVARFKSVRIRNLLPEDVAALTYAINNARVEGVPEEELRDAIELEREMLLAVASKKKSKWWWACCAGANCAGGAKTAIDGNTTTGVTKNPKQYM